jgi:signal transduction histidine kinase
MIDMEKYQGGPKTLSLAKKFLLTVITLVYFHPFPLLAQIQDPVASPQVEDYGWYASWWAFLFFTLVAAALITLFITYNSRNFKKEKIVLEKKLEISNAELERVREELKATQNQLIRSEKMATLGELTAGIAHEIQNPLNFVNNFSELNKELILELREEISKGNLDEVKLITEDIEGNEDKINFHGKRADSIVKSMLYHSRSGNGHKEPTDINKVADECMRLSYHGMRAKDKSFNATLETKLDDTIPPIEMIPQDISRVLVNIFTNAFYALRKKQLHAGPDYKPTVWLTTSQSEKGPVICIRDNGTGIPEEVKDKIYEPFFTTKPTGEGTGLGLSMSYDIITKGHGGELMVETKEGEFTQFRIVLNRLKS